MLHCFAKRIWSFAGIQTVMTNKTARLLFLFFFNLAVLFSEVKMNMHPFS